MKILDFTSIFDCIIINQGGKVVSEPQFDRAGIFLEGLARVQIGDKWGYINHKGEIVIKPQFDDARSFFK